MKCIIIRNAQERDKAMRLPDNEAEQMVWGGNYEYCPKHVWKRTVRDPETLTQ